MQGYLFAALAAALYGTNPLFAVPLYSVGMNATSVLLYRYLLGIPILALMLIAHSERLLPHLDQLMPAGCVGIVMGISSLALYEAYGCMNPGIASTLLFMYPLFTTVIMTVFYHEKLRLLTCLSLAIMFAGLYLLLNPGPDAAFNFKGVALTTISALSYAAYLIAFKVSKTLQAIPNKQSLLVQLMSGSLVFVAASASGQALTLPASLFAWGNLAALTILPTVLSLLFTIRAIRLVGPTPTALFGGLEPITAVLLSILFLGQSLTLDESIGGLLIILATMLVIISGREKTKNA